MISTTRPAASHGILLIDKPRGCTSHDVVGWARRVFGQRDIGHAGTLDPMATGLLVILLGEATKLSAYLTADDKRYDATVRFGEATDSLDADGVTTERREGDPPTVEAARRALDAMVGTMEQVPPAVSAIKQGGVPLHERARRGQEIIPVPRTVVLRDAQLHTVHGADAEITVECSKGFYVRALARDLAERLGTVAHLVALRRVRAGVFDVRDAVSGEDLRRAARERDEAAASAVRGALRGSDVAASAMRVLRVDADTARKLGFGQPICTDLPEGPVLVLGEASGEPVCVGRITTGLLGVARGFNSWH